MESTTNEGLVFFMPDPLFDPGELFADLDYAVSDRATKGADFALGQIEKFLVAELTRRAKTQILLIEHVFQIHVSVAISDEIGDVMRKCTGRLK